MMVGCLGGAMTDIPHRKYTNWPLKDFKYQELFNGYIWKSKCTPRIKFFAWLMMVDRLNTKIMLRRRHYNTQAGIYCILCNHNAEEDVDHLFFGCPFAVNCWLRLNIVWDLDLELHHRISQTRSVFQQDFFMEVFLIGAWELWKVRNAVIFDNA